MKQHSTQQEVLFQALLNNSGKPGFGRYIGVKLTEIQEGSACGEMEITPNLCNPMGVVHGGALVGLADTVCGYTTSTLGVYCVTSSSQINYVRPAKGKRMICTAEVRKRGNNLCVLTAEIHNEEGIEVAFGTFEFFVLGKINPDRVFEELENLPSESGL